MEDWNSLESEDANSMSTGTINDVDVETLVPSIRINGPGEDEDDGSSSLKDSLRFINKIPLKAPVEVSTERRNRFDEIADKIINAFTIKTEDRFIDSDEGIMSKKDSEARLIIMGSVLGIMLNVTLSAMLVLASIVFSDKFAVTTYHPLLEKSNTYPTPYLFIMAKLGLGDIVVLRQNKELNFEIDFNFKVPANKVNKGFIMDPDGDGLEETSNINPWKGEWFVGRSTDTTETGFSVFEDRGDLFIVYSDTTKRIVVLNPSNKHKTLRKSQLPTNHFYSNSIIRTGDFVWIFGGYSVPTTHPKSNCSREFDNHGCSSIKYGAEEHTFPGSAMWHMDKQVWFEGPSLPIKTCSVEATAISLNKTDVLIFIGPFIGSYLKNVEGEEWVNEKGGCIQVLHFSYKTFSWVSQHDCFIDFGPRSYTFKPSKSNISNILSLVSTSVLDKDGKL